VETLVGDLNGTPPITARAPRSFREPRAYKYNLMLESWPGEPRRNLAAQVGHRDLTPDIASAVKKGASQHYSMTIRRYLREMSGQ
jgi:hypothetical protein